MDIRHEYINGEVFSMVGALAPHNLISTNLLAAFHGHLRGTPCQVFMNDMKVQIETANTFYYPDIMVVCENLKVSAESYFQTTARLIIEVLSPSAATRDPQAFEDSVARLAQLLIREAQGEIELYAPYSLELNLIEILWRKIKYQWLPVSAYDSFAKLKEELFEILANIGTEYRIVFHDVKIFMYYYLSKDVGEILVL